MLLNLIGELSKGFDGIKKEENSLFPIHLHETATGGFIFVNFDEKETPTPFSDHFVGFQKELDTFDFKEFSFHSSFELTGNFNWKTLMDGYQVNAT